MACWRSSTFGKVRDATGGSTVRLSLFARPRCLSVHMIFALALFRLFRRPAKYQATPGHVTTPRKSRLDEETRSISAVARLRGPSPTTQGSAVRTRHRLRRERSGQRVFSESPRIRTDVLRGAKSNKSNIAEHPTNPTSRNFRAAPRRAMNDFLQTGRTVRRGFDFLSHRLPA
jgi:hypothetical protein